MLLSISGQKNSTLTSQLRLTIKGSEIIFTRTFSKQSIQNNRTGISYNTCRLAGPHPQSSAKTRHQIKKLKGCLCEFFFQMATIQVLGSVAVERVEVGLLACRLFGGSSLFSCLIKYLINIRTFIGCLTNKCGIVISSDRNIIDSPRLVSVLKRSPVDVFVFVCVIDIAR